MNGKKENMLNVRLDNDTNQKLTEYSEQHGSSKSAIVNEALAMYFNKEQSKQLPYTLGEDLFGTAKSVKTDLSKSYKDKLKSKLREKHTH